MCTRFISINHSPSKVQSDIAGGEKKETESNSHHTAPQTGQLSSCVCELGIQADKANCELTSRLEGSRTRSLRSGAARLLIKAVASYRFHHFRTDGVTIGRRKRHPGHADDRCEQC
ncbi:beta-lactamase [Anopheles sinensis]|uniref:Beta-lactamase n=1 Tax=Anopheles sinensis TaxID=74873 RepID=A0A084WMJ1_ANOSI|nr:beta-lactamase [Anopheles sinensis]